MDVATALIGSGPAFVYEFIKQLSLASESLGLEKHQATVLASQMTQSAAHLISQHPEQIEHHQNQVVSKGGTTAAGLEALADNGFGNAVEKAIVSATYRARAISKDMTVKP